MPEGDQERFEDYLELERYLAALQEDRRPPLSAELTPTQARLYRLAALLRAAAPGAAEPRPEFVAELRARLEHELAASEDGPREPEEAAEPATLPAAAPSPSPPGERRSRLSRRRLLAGSAVAAASLVAGAGLDRALQESSGGSHGGDRPDRSESHQHKCGERHALAPCLSGSDWGRGAFSLALRR